MIQYDMMITTALIYANGPLHLGHLIEHVQADIWVRFQRMQDKKCLFIGGNDAHGTPIMLSSEQQNISPETLIQSIHQAHQKDLDDFHIHYDQFSTTHDEENRVLTEKIFHRLVEHHAIDIRDIEQPYDPKEKLFLPDRYIKGNCPKCQSPDQYGDNCQACGATYHAQDLVNPKSVLSDASPVMKTSKHYFFKLGQTQKMLETWLDQLDCESSIVNKLKEWFTEGLQDWDISRDAPYFGFNIPDEPDKYFYVWLDAPIGYMAASQQYCQKHALNFDALWAPDSTTQLIHFIGKDITYFHGLFWPAMLDVAGFRKPSSLYTHGFLTLNGHKMSKSRNTFITVRAYLDQLDPEYLRYYFATKLTPHIEDMDLNWEDLKTRIDSELVSKIINIASRCAKLLERHFNNRLSDQLVEPKLYEQCIQAGDHIAQYFEQRHYSKAVQEINRTADCINQYLTEQAPWTLLKTDPTSQHAADVCSLGIQCFRCLITYLKPITPELADRAEQFLGHRTLFWNDCKTPLTEHTLNPYTHLLSRVPEQPLHTLIASSTSTS